MRVIAARLRGVRTGSALGVPGQATAGLLAGDRTIVRSMALIKHDLPCRACEIAGQRRAPVVHGWSGDRDERFTASPGTLVGGLQAVRRGGGAPAARCRPPVPLAVSESGQLGARRYDPRTARTEIHDLYSNAGPVALASMEPGCIARIVPVGVGWMLSGARQTFDASQRAALLEVAAELAAEYPRLVFRNPGMVTRGWELARKQRAIFIEFFGSDLLLGTRRRGPAAQAQAVVPRSRAAASGHAAEQRARRGSPIIGVGCLPFPDAARPAPS